MRFLFILSLACLPAIGLTQTKYHCEYAAKMSSPFPDSIIENIRAKLEEKGLPAQFADQFLADLKNKGMTGEYSQIVDGRPDSTFIVVKMKEENEGTEVAEVAEGSFIMRMPTRFFLFYKGEIYQYDSARAGFLPKATEEPPKNFVGNKETKVVAGHSCKGYTSTDGNCTIWVAPDLPSYINPGIKAGDIKGAVLAYRLKNKGVVIESEMETMEPKRLKL